MKTFNARQLLTKTTKPFATRYKKYEVLFTPHFLGSMIEVKSKNKDSLCGTWLLADAPTDIVFALAHAAKKLK